MNTLAQHAYDDRVIIPALKQGTLLGFEIDNAQLNLPANTYFNAPDIDLSEYDRFVVCMSGGKDSLAGGLRLIEAGVPKEKIEFWHHLIDPVEHSRNNTGLMDWTFMHDYVNKVAAALGIKVYYSWLDGGFEGELMKQNSVSRPLYTETPDGLELCERDLSRAKPNTRMRFPQQAGDLRTRWCSSMLKIDVGRRALTKQPRFNHSKTLFITGERRQESPGRSRYNQFETHSADTRSGRLGRHVDTWRNVLHFDEAEVWALLEKYNIIAPLPYRLGWGRSSCMTCIFNSPRIWATIAEYFPERANRIATLEDQFGTTISRNRINVLQVGAQVEPMKIEDPELLLQAVSYEYTLPVLLEPGQKWELPKGAFSAESCGST